MIVLGIDTATRTASAALLDDGRVLAEESLPSKGGLAASFFPLLERVFGGAGRAVGDVDLVAVSIGPGSFTGLRIGLSSAKGIALSTGCDLVAVPTLEALAQVALDEGARLTDRQVCTVLDARKREVYGALFAVVPGAGKAAATLTRVVEECVIKPERLVGFVEQPCVVLGDGVAPYCDVWQQLPAGSELLPFSQYHPRGSLVARLGVQLHAVRGSDPIDALAPRYCRRSEAEINLAKRAGERNSA